MTALIIHRLWLGPADMPAHYHTYGHEWARMNPGWRVVDWHTQDVGFEPVRQRPPANYTQDIFTPTFLTNLRVWDELANGAVSPIPTMHPAVAIATQRADVAGYEIVAKMYGLYVNCDMQPLNPLSGLSVPLGQVMAARESPHHLSNAALWGVIGHPFYHYVVDQLPKRFFDNRHKPMNQTTGPYLLTECHRDWQLERHEPGVFVAAQNFFNYAHYDNVRPGGDATQFRAEAKDWGAVAIHHWGHRGQQRGHS